MKLQYLSWRNIATSQCLNQEIYNQACKSSPPQSCLRKLERYIYIYTYVSFWYARACFAIEIQVLRNGRMSVAPVISSSSPLTSPASPANVSWTILHETNQYCFIIIKTVLVRADNIAVLAQGSQAPKDVGNTGDVQNFKL